MSERNRDCNQPFRHEGHRKPITRRDFLAQGFLSGAAMVMAPTWLSALGRPGTAAAQTPGCTLSAGAGKVPFVCFDLAGGASVAGSNVMVGGAGGQLDFISEGGYLNLGLPSTMLPALPGQLNSELGLAFHADSAFLRGILSKTSVDTRSRVNGSIICVRSDNDTGNNPHNPMYGISKAGADGDLVGLIGTDNSESGGRSVAPPLMIDPTLRPTKVDRPSDVTGLVDTGKLVALLDQNDAGAVMSTMENITDLKLNRINENTMVEDLVRCGYAQSTQLVAQYGNPALLDPMVDLDIVGAPTSIFTAAEANQSKFRKTLSVMKLVCNGFAGAGTIEFGGYDYHDSTRATGEVRDFEAGQAMGAVLEYAARRGQQLMLYVFSDGSVNCDGTLDNSVDGRGKGIWKSDASSTAAVFFLVYDPIVRPALTSPARAQIGYFRDNGSVETGATRVSNNVTLLADAVVANYLALHDDLGSLDAVLPNHGLGNATEVDSLIAFAPIR